MTKYILLLIFLLSFIFAGWRFFYWFVHAKGGNEPFIGSIIRYHMVNSYLPKIEDEKKKKVLFYSGSKKEPHYIDSCYYFSRAYYGLDKRKCGYSLFGVFIYKKNSCYTLNTICDHENYFGDIESSNSILEAIENRCIYAFSSIKERYKNKKDDEIYKKYNDVLSEYGCDKENKAHNPIQIFFHQKDINMIIEVVR